MYDLNFAVHKLPKQSIGISRNILVIDVFRLILIKSFMRDLDLIVKFIYSEKATHFSKSSPYF
jgi:hypothetical protein